MAAESHTLEPLPSSPQALEIAGRHEAQEITQKLRDSLTGIQEMMIEAFRKKVWLSLGYESWNEYVAGEFADLKLGPPKEERAGVLAGYYQAGMSTRAIAAATGLSKDTVSRTLKQAKETGELEEIPVLGLDGRVRSYRQEEEAEPHGSSGPGGELFDLPDELLDTPAVEVGIGSLKPQKKREKPPAAEKKVLGPQGRISSAPKTSSQPAEAAGAAQDGEPAFVELQGIMGHLNESIKALGIEDEAKRPFASQDYPYALIEQTLLCLGSLSHLLARLNLEPDLLGQDSKVADVLETVVSHLDTQLLHLRN